jgi:hypothetical protein
MKAFLKKFRIPFGIILVLVLVDTWLVYFHTPGWNSDMESTSPDGRYTVLAYFNTGVFFLPPFINPRGNAGTIVLRDNETGKVLQRGRMEEVVVDSSIVRWYPDHVSVVSVGVWNLPQEDTSK